MTKMNGFDDGYKSPFINMDLSQLEYRITGQMQEVRNELFTNLQSLLFELSSPKFEVGGIYRVETGYPFRNLEEDFTGNVEVMKVQAKVDLTNKTIMYLYDIEFQNIDGTGFDEVPESSLLDMLYDDDRHLDDQEVGK